MKKSAFQKNREMRSLVWDGLVYALLAVGVFVLVRACL